MAKMTSNTPESSELPVLDRPVANRSDTGSEDAEVSPTTVSPNYVKWARSLQELLNDPKGLKLFQDYLEQEDLDRFYMLKFWYACRGVAQQDPTTADQAIRIIYKKLFLKIKSGIKEEVRRSISNQMREAKNKKLDLSSPDRPLLTVSVFSEACKIVEKEMNDVMYPNFIISEKFINYITENQGNVDTNSHEAPALLLEQDVELPINYSQPPTPPKLPVVDEEKELSPSQYFMGKRRISSSSRLSSLGKIARQPIERNRYLFPNPRLHHNSFTHNSELASVSSGGRSESVNDLTVDDASVSKNTYVYQRQMQKLHGCNIKLNKDSGLLPFMPPRTSNPLALEQAKPPSPEVFAKQLSIKLEELKREIDSRDLLDKKLSLIDSDKNTSDLSEFNSSIKESKIDENDQEILDNHVSRIWTDKTPKQSSAVGTPICPKSPSESKKSFPIYLKTSDRNSAPSLQSSGSMKSKIKELSSMGSLDSGNFTDLTEGYCHSRHMSKYKSVSESGYSASDHHSLIHHQRGNRGWTISSQHTLNDSGVSDVENSQASSSIYNKKISNFFGIPEEREQFISFSNKHKLRSMSGYSHDSSRMKGAILDRTASSSSRLHTFVSDPNMPPFSYHNVNTDVQLDEACRRLNAGIEHKLNRSTASTHGSCTSTRLCESLGRNNFSQTGSKIEIPLQKSSTLTRNNYKSSGDEHSRSKSSNTEDTVFTTVVYNFSDEEMPYLLKVPGNPITLKMFKEYMPPKKLGYYRYFFVTSCEELENLPIQEEITDDNQFLPLWKGKVNAQIKAIE